MDPWEQKLKDSGVVEAVDLLESKLDSYSGAELTIEDRGNLLKIRAVNEQVQAIVQGVDPKIVNYSALPTIVSNLNNASSYLDSWGGGESPTYLSSHAINEIDAAIKQIPLLSAAVNIPEARSAITNLRRSAARQRTIVDDITRKIEEKGTLADTTIDEKLTEFTDSIEKQVAVVVEKIDTIKTEAGDVETQLEEVKIAANKLNTDQNEVFNAAQTNRTKEFEDFIKDQENEADGLLSSIASKATTEVGAVKDKAEQSAKLAEEARLKSEELLGIVSQNALINDYSKNGLHEQKWARIWQSITAIALLAAVITGAALALSTDEDTSWQKLVARLAILIATGGLAAYAASQASEHKQAQRQSEHLSLQLSAVRPYLADIDSKADRDKLLVKLAEKFFSEKKAKETARNSGKKRKEENNISGDDLPGLIGAIISIANTASKK